MADTFGWLCANDNTIFQKTSIKIFEYKKIRTILNSSFSVVVTVLRVAIALFKLVIFNGYIYLTFIDDLKIFFDKL